QEPNVAANLPGPLQGQLPAPSRNAAPVSFSRWFGANKLLLSLETLPRRMLAVPFRNSDHLVQRCVYHLLARSARPLVTDHSLVVDYIERRRGGQVPPRRDRSRTGVASVDKGPPGYLLLVHHLLELLRVEATNVDADEREGLFFQVRHEPPLVWPLGPSGQSD